MSPAEITALRKALNLTQNDFARLFDVHFMTVSKWERGQLMPTAYQVALMEEFRKTAVQKEVEAKEEVKKLLVGAGVIAALLWLLSNK